MVLHNDTATATQPTPAIMPRALGDMFSTWLSDPAYAAQIIDAAIMDGNGWTGLV
jgi:hypothetical protein